MRTGFSRALLATLLLAVTLQAGCVEFTMQDKAVIRDIAKDWLRERNMSPTNEDGSIDYIGAYNFGRAALGQSDDQDANAILGAYTAVSGVLAGDKLMDEARASGDAAKMDSAIQSRPQDWTYRSSRAALALAQGDMATYEAQTKAFTDIANGQKVPLSRQARQVVKDFEPLAIPESGEQAFAKYQALSGAYAELYKETGNPVYEELMYVNSEKASSALGQ